MNQYSPALADEPSLAPAPPAHHAHLRRPPLKLFLLVIALVGAMAAVSLLPIRAWVSDAGRVRLAAEALGMWKYPACIVVVGILVACGVPRLIFCAAGGLILGFWWGLALVSAGTVLGYYSVFLFVRWGGRDWVIHRWPALSRWSDMIRGQGFVAVLLARQLPLHGTFVNLVLGLSHVRHRHFLLGSAIGLLPEAIPLTLVGAHIEQASHAGRGQYIAMAAVALAGLWIAAGYVVSQVRKKRSPAPVEAEPGQP